MLWTAGVRVLQAGEETNVICAVMTALMDWSVVSDVTVFMLTDVNLQLDTVAVCPAGRVFTVTVCVLRAAGGPAALSPVTVRMGHHVHLMRVLVSVHLDSEEPPVSAFVLLVTLVIAVVKRVRSVSIAMAHVIM